MIAVEPSSSIPVKSDSLSFINCSERMINITPKAVSRAAAEAVSRLGVSSIAQLIKP